MGRIEKKPLKLQNQSAKNNKSTGTITMNISAGDIMLGSPEATKPTGGTDVVMDVTKEQQLQRLDRSQENRMKKYMDRLWEVLTAILVIFSILLLKIMPKGDPVTVSQANASVVIDVVREDQVDTETAMNSPAATKLHVKIVDNDINGQQIQGLDEDEQQTQGPDKNEQNIQGHNTIEQQIQGRDMSEENLKNLDHVWKAIAVMLAIFCIVFPVVSVKLRVPESLRFVLVIVEVMAEFALLWVVLTCSKKE